MAAAAPTANSIVRPLVLLVDDDQSVLQALTALLAPRLEPWFRLMSAESLHDALELLDAEDDLDSPLALVISDEKMPGGTGTELLVRLRTRPGHQHGGRIIVTGYADLESAKRAINDAEVERYYPKPWDAERELMPAVGEILAAFVRGRGFDRVLLARPIAWQEVRAEALALRVAWWEYVNLMGMSAEEMQVKLPALEDVADAESKHVHLMEWALGERFAIGSARLRLSDKAARLEATAFLPGAATDDAEALLLRAAQQEARRGGAERLELEASPLRAEFYTSLGFASASVSAQPNAQPVVTTMWTCDMTRPATDAWSRRYALESRLCSCAQHGCPARDYDAARRSYFCPLDLHEGRLPQGFPGPAVRTRR